MSCRCSPPPHTHPRAHTPSSTPPQGGHYWDKAAIKDDPWAAASYTTNHGPDATKGTAEVHFGLTAAAAHGRAVVVHDHAGARVTCTLIDTEPLIEVLVVGGQEGGSFGRYPGYGGSLSLTGEAVLRFRGQGNVSVVHRAEGVEAACSDGGDRNVPNSCGIHIHEVRQFSAPLPARVLYAQHGR